jgi:hypothetical protein
MKIGRDRLPTAAHIECYRVSNYRVAGADENVEWFFSPRSLAGNGSYAWVWVGEELREIVVEEESEPDRQEWWRKLPLFTAAKYAREAVEQRLAKPVEEFHP